MVLRIVDRVSGTFSHAVVRFYLHPAINNLTGQTLRLPNGQCAQWSASGGTPKIVRSVWHPEFGVSIANQCIEIEFEGPEVALSAGLDAFLKILVLSFYYQPDLSAGSFRTTALVQALSAILPGDAQIDVITTMPNRYISFSEKVPDRAFEQFDRLTIRRISASGAPERHA